MKENGQSMLWLLACLKAAISRSEAITHPRACFTCESQHTREADGRRGDCT